MDYYYGYGCYVKRMIKQYDAAAKTDEFTTGFCDVHIKNFYLTTILGLQDC